MLATCLATFAWLPAPQPSSAERPFSQSSADVAALATSEFEASNSFSSTMDDEHETVDRNAPLMQPNAWLAWARMIGQLSPGVATAWIAGVLLLSLRHCGGWLGVRHLRRRGAALAGARWVTVGQALAARMNLRQSVTLLESSAVRIPIVIGWLKPVVLLPISLLGEMTPAQVEAVLAHELAHIRRQDYLVNLAQILTETLLFYHPATWWVSRQIRIEREHCCDDEASRACAGGALALSEALTLIVTSRLVAQTALAATGPSPASALSRVQRLLSPTDERLRASRGASAVLGMLVLSLAATLALGRLATAEPAEETLAQFKIDERVGGPEKRSDKEPDAKPEPRKPSIIILPQLVPAQAVDLGKLELSGGTAPIGQDARRTMAIFVMRRDGSDLHELARTPDHTLLEQPRWSHDGKRVLFTGERGPRGGRDFYIVNADGTKLTRRGAYGHADWSPDDEQILFDVYTPAAKPAIGEDVTTRALVERAAAEQGRGSYVQKLDGTDDAKISSGLCPRWSPDGNRIAVTDHKMLRVIDLARDKETALFEVPFEYIFSGYNWSPDSKWLALSAKTTPTSNRKLLLVSADGEKKGLKLVREGEQGGSISFSPDGKALVFSDGYKLHMTRLVGSKKTSQIPGFEGRAQDPHWSPDGKWIVFSGERKPKAEDDEPADAPAAEGPISEAPAADATIPEVEVEDTPISESPSADTPIPEAQGAGLRINVPALGPAHIALDFAVPIDQARGNHQQPFSYFVGLSR
jgi:beta-lactamase regulating signal transducer with metallopeptidase domain